MGSTTRRPADRRRAAQTHKREDRGCRPQRLADALVQALGIAWDTDPASPAEVLLDVLQRPSERSPAQWTLGELLSALESGRGEARTEQTRNEVTWAVRRRAVLDPELSLERLARVFLEARTPRARLES